MKNPVCRYEDCPEGNPVGEEDARITCETCRDELGLPAINYAVEYPMLYRHAIWDEELEEWISTARNK